MATKNNTFDAEKNRQLLKVINDKNKLIIFGYIRQCQDNLFVKEQTISSYYNISELIIHLCLYFYFRDWDEFDKNNKSKNIIIDNNKKSIKQIVNNWGWHSISLSNIVNKGIHRWIFEINKNNLDCWELIGIWKCNKCQFVFENSFDSIGVDTGYCWCMSQGALVDPNSPGTRLKDYGSTITEINTNNNHNNIIQMILNFDQLTLSYIIKGVDYGVAFDNIEQTEYKAAVTLASKDSKLTLKSYEYFASGWSIVQKK